MIISNTSRLYMSVPNFKWFRQVIKKLEQFEILVSKLLVCILDNFWQTSKCDILGTALIQTLKFWNFVPPMNPHNISKKEKNPWHQSSLAISLFFWWTTYFSTGWPFWQMVYYSWFVNKKRISYRTHRTSIELYQTLPEFLSSILFDLVR